MPELKQTTFAFAKGLPNNPSDDEIKKANSALILELGSHLSEWLTGGRYHINLSLWTRSTKFGDETEIQQMLNVDAYEVEEA